MKLADAYGFYVGLVRHAHWVIERSIACRDLSTGYLWVRTARRNLERARQAAVSMQTRRATP